MRKFFALLLFFLNFPVEARMPSDFSPLFKDYEVCFILYSVNEQKIVSKYNPNHRCQEPISPNSTFKIALSLMAFDQGIIDQKTLFKWDGKKSEINAHNQDQTALSWLQNSVVWVSQQLTPQLGYDRIKKYLADFHYGNQDFKGDPGKNNGLRYAWLGASLKISAIEQLQFLTAMITHKLPLNNQAIQNTMANLYLGKLDNGAKYYGKTGSGRYGPNERTTNPSRLRQGWFVGFVRSGPRTYVFVSNLIDKWPQKPINGSLIPYGSVLLKPITLQLLNRYFATQQS